MIRVEELRRQVVLGFRQKESSLSIQTLRRLLRR